VLEDHPLALIAERNSMKAIWLAARPILFAVLWLAVLGASLPFLARHTLRLSAAAQQPNATVVNAASFESAVAPDAIAAAFGAFKTQNDQPFIATTRPLPTTLGGVRVTVNGVDAGLFFASNTQINFVMPSATAAGPASVVITNSDNTTRTATPTVTSTAPGIFTVGSTGQGTAAAQTTFDGLNLVNVFNPDGSEREVEAGTAARPSFLILYLTGVRRAAAGTVAATIQGVPARVDFAGTQGGFDGLDQINLVIPPELAGFGRVQVRVTVGGQTSNVATIKLGGQRTPVAAQTIAAGVGVVAGLTATDQVQDAGDGSNRTYFFDAYQFSAAANTAIAIDLRSAQFDPLIILYRRGSNQALNFFAFDDQTGGLGNGSVENNNALLLAVLPEAGDYVIFATSADAEPNAVGTYTLTLAFNAVQAISYGTTLANAGLAMTDLQTSAGTYLDAYWFTGQQGDSVQITMRSTAFNSFLIFNLNTGDLIELNDNDGGGQDAQVIEVLPETGAYIIIATPFEPNRTGSYSIGLTRLTGALAGAPAQTVVPGPEQSAADGRFELSSARRLAGRGSPLMGND
jgi:uncharacterized protein (TIGR03437 family)